MIYAYTGLPGSGKSYSAVAYAILPALRDGRKVITNVPLKLDKLREDIPDAHVEHINLSDYEADNPNRKSFLEDMTPGALVVLDELWRLWPAGLKTVKVPEDHKSFLAEHRHRVGKDGRSTDIILITQDLSQVAAFCRALVDKTYITTKLDALGTKTRAKLVMAQGAVTGNKVPKAQHLRTSNIKYRPDIYQYYQSATQSQAGDAGTEGEADKRANIWRSPMMVGIVAFCIIVPPIAAKKISGFFGSFSEHEQVTEADLTPGPTPRPTQWPAVQYAYETPATPTPEPTQAPSSNSWQKEYRLMGYVYKTDTGEGYAILENAIGSVRLHFGEACEHIKNSPDFQCTFDGKTVRYTTGYGALSGKRYQNRGAEDQRSAGVGAQPLRSTGYQSQRPEYAPMQQPYSFR